MNKIYSYGHYLVAFIFLIILIVSYCNKSFGQDLSKPITRGLLPLKNDTTHPKVQYFLKLPYTQDQFRKKIDTVYQVSMLLGKSMSVDQSEQYKSLILSVLNNLSKDAKIDSTKK